MLANDRVRIAEREPTMRAPLRWILLITVALTALSLWWPADEARVAGHVVAAAAAPESPPRSARNEPAPPSALPAALPRQELGKAEFDPFVGAQPAAPPPPKPVMTPIAATPPPAPPPAPPPLTYRYIGRMQDPDGKPSVYLAKADKHLAVGVGMTLEEGYIVEAIDGDAIRLRYPPLDARASIPIPQSVPIQ